MPTSGSSEMPVASVMWWVSCCGKGSGEAVVELTAMKASLEFFGGFCLALWGGNGFLAEVGKSVLLVTLTENRLCSVG